MGFVIYSELKKCRFLTESNNDNVHFHFIYGPNLQMDWAPATKHPLQISDVFFHNFEWKNPQVMQNADMFKSSNNFASNLGAEGGGAPSTWLERS